MSSRMRITLFIVGVNVNVNVNIYVNVNVGFGFGLDFYNCVVCIFELKCYFRKICHLIELRLA